MNESVFFIVGAISFVLCIIGTVRYNKLRQKWSGIIGVGGAYIIFLGILLLFAVIGTAVSLLTGQETDTSEIIPSAIVMVVCLGYMAVCMLRCDNVKQRIMLPFVACLIGAGFCWRLIAAVALHIPMSNGESCESDIQSMPNIIYDDNNNRWQLQHRNRDSVVYHNDAGHTITIYSGQVSNSGANTDAGNFHWY